MKCVFVLHYSDVIISAMASQITGVWIVCQSFVQAQIEENIKAPRHCPLWGEFTSEGNSPVTGEFSTQRASKAENSSIWWRHHVFDDCTLCVYVWWSISLCTFVIVVPCRKSLFIGTFCTKLGWGLLSQFPRSVVFPAFSELWKHWN